MTQDWPVHNGYDPTWRSFKGKTTFVPHPSSLETTQELVWPQIYVPVGAPALTGRTLATPGREPANPDAGTPAGWPVSPGVETSTIPGGRPPVPSSQPIFEPAIAPGEPVAPVDYKALRVPTPMPTTPIGKLTALFPQAEDPAPPRPKKRHTRPWAARPVGMASIVGVIVVAAIATTLIPRLLSTQPTLKAMFTAPMLVLRAVGPSAVTNVSVSIGQPVDPSTVLLTIHANPLSDAAVGDLKTRLTQAQLRQTALDAPGAPPATSRQKEAAAAEVDQLQKALAAAGGSGNADQPILAGVRGVVWSLDAQAGAKLKAGDPLVQLADCGRAFLVVQGTPSGLKAGQTVLIRMPGVRPFHGSVRPSVGQAEPQNTLVIDPTGFSAAAPNACPVGASADVQPETSA